MKKKRDFVFLPEDRLIWYNRLCSIPNSFSPIHDKRFNGFDDESIFR
jgi:hypothetical protein